MQGIRTKLSKGENEVLRRFLVSPQRPDGTLCFQELQGFLFAVASCPEMIQPSDWLPIISDDEDIGFNDQSEAQRILNLIMTLFNQVNCTVLDRSDKMPPGCKFQNEIDANFEEDAAISQWSLGFILGHDWLADVWDECVPESLAGECGSTAMVLSFFGSKQLAEAYYFESTTTPKHRKPDKSFTEFAELVQELFPAALSSYAHLGRTISEAIETSAEKNH
jgi:uncharacterized protein